MRATRSTAMQSEINVTPLVDVCLVLLIIFMVVTPIIVNGVPVHLPPAATADPLAKQPLLVTINADGVIYVGASVLRSDQLADELQRLRAQSDRPVIVRAEKTLPYGEVVRVLDACRTAGFEHVGLGTETTPVPSPSRPR
ncbi:MAG: ExbD/TolR family protein [Thermoanaerobaculia bacterium]